MQKILVIGAGHGAGQLLDSLRRGGCEDAITLVGEEPWLPYQRPPLSKKFLSGEMSQKRLAFRPEDFYTRHQITTRLSCRAVSLDRDAACVELDTGERLPFDRLAIATGARVRELSVPGAGLKGVHYLRGIDDARHLQNEWADKQEVCVIGGGFIGLEVAASARALGKNVTVVEALDRLMARAVTPELVFEIGFEGLAKSTRHKSGIATRFPRILRWRRDKLAKDADNLETLKKLLPPE